MRGKSRGKFGTRVAKSSPESSGALLAIFGRTKQPLTWQQLPTLTSVQLSDGLPVSLNRRASSSRQS